jgi:hypothetical protein
MRAAVCTVAMLLVAACAKPASDRQHAAQSKAGQLLDCALEGTGRYQRICTFEVRSGSGGAILVLHKPDGGFRRLKIVKDGRGLVAADGSEPAMVHIESRDSIEVSIGDDRFLLPATLQPRG